MLAALHDPVAVCVPAAVDPAKLERVACTWPHAAQELVVAGELSVAIEFDQTSELTVGGSELPIGGPLERQRGAKLHMARVVGRAVELDVTPAARQFAEEKGRGGLVVPHVGASPKADTGMVEAPLPAVEEAIGAAKRRLRSQRAEVEEGGFFDGVRDVRGAEPAHESNGVAFERSGRRSVTCSVTFQASRNWVA